MTYPEAVEYLDSFVNYERTLPLDYMRAFKLERMNHLMGLLDNPHKKLRVIHIAGTKGKGSTAALITSILKESGLRAGLYTSPHLTSFRERIRINDELIGERSLAEIVSEIRPQLERIPP